jgi:hypothetical protein
MAQNVAQPFFQNFNIGDTTVEKSSPKVWATSVIFKTSAQSAQSPTGEKSPNLVTLPCLTADASI